MSSSIKVMETACDAVVYRNTSLWTSPGEGKPPAPPVEFTDLLCPDNCNGRGTCHDGAI